MQRSAEKREAKPHMTQWIRQGTLSNDQKSISNYKKTIAMLCFVKKTVRLRNLPLNVYSAPADRCRPAWRRPCWHKTALLSPRMKLVWKWRNATTFIAVVSLLMCCGHSSRCVQVTATSMNACLELCMVKDWPTVCQPSTSSSAKPPSYPSPHATRSASTGVELFGA